MKALPYFCLILILAVLAGTAQSAEEIYKWIDEDGVTHYSARPPEGVEYQRVTTEADRATARNDAASTSQNNDEPEAEPQVTGALPQLAEVTVEEPDPALVAERCEQARNNLSWLTQRTRISMTNEDGTLRRISEEERQAQISENQAFIDEWC